MHADTATRQHWMSVLAHSQPTELAARLNALNITADYEVIRAAETGLVQIQARMGGTGERFFAGDATLTRAAVRLTDGTLGYSWVLGRDKQHAERCALIDALMQQTRHFQNLSETLIAPLNADRMARIAARQAEVVAQNGLVEVMREMLQHPERHDWLATRLEITSLLRTDPSFAARWKENQSVRDEAVRARLASNADKGRLRDDVEIDTLAIYLEVFMDGFINRLALGDTAELEKVLDLVEQSIRGAQASPQ